ncbi:hypothetical protein [Phyllobacterium endophyticum]|uniref:Uncharacterized protein n=1 Tax=Phyllobacterium endophyticum TaxID=1149773 RepID=A0A2P7AYM7_9HYPH|nr:hypothetical protein [Phyllobacterium endophyticum]MBB3236130.1 hypothetical protein [Phyllobacterium endophyticum]PSH59317.1 hypothetical protein CU100_00480 [Phyllobacterium endophyticum]TYR41442.1 hypothetical protein FY050_09130 [Phyllobacterium endophyticum]
MTKRLEEDAEALEIASSIVAMAKDTSVAKDYVDVFFILDVMLSGNKDAARDAIVSYLRTGKAPALVQRLAADFLDPVQHQHGRGRPVHYRPSRWWEIGIACNELREMKPPAKNVVVTVAQRLNVSESEAKRADTFYRKVYRNIDRLTG